VTRSDPFAALRKQAATHGCADRVGFRRRYPACVATCDLLWPLLDDTNAALLALPPGEYDRLTGREWSPDDSPVQHPGVLVRVDRATSQQGDRSYQVRGAAVADVLDLLERRNELRERQQEAEAGDRDADPDALADAASRLDGRARRREDLDSSFDGEWVGSGAVDAAYLHDPSERGHGTTQVELGA